MSNDEPNGLEPMKSGAVTPAVCGIRLPDSPNRRRPDIDTEKTYLVLHHGDWFFGRFDSQWYGWNFRPPLCAQAGMQIEWLSEIWEVTSVGGQPYPS